MSDPFEQLRVVEEGGRPDTGFVARLRAQVVAALEAAALPTVPLPERSTTVTSPTTSASSTTAAQPVTVAITPYLCVAGAVDAIAWYADVLGAVETIRYTGDDGRIGHAEISIGGATVMLSDEHPEFGVTSPTTLGGTPVSLHVTVPDVDAVHERAVAAGARIERPPRDEAYGARSFTMDDPFGHRWMIQTPIGEPTREQIEADMPGYTITGPDE
jgi:PhnB protein